MYTDKEAEELRQLMLDPGLEAKVGAERLGKWAAKLAEYDSTHAQSAADQPALSEGDIQRLETPLAIGGALPNESIAPDYQYHPPEDFDPDLPNASKRKKWADPPEYVTKSPGKALLTLAKNRMVDPLNGTNGAMYFEPSEKQFAADMGEYLKAKGVAPGSEDYAHAYADYKDRKWHLAYEQAAATDTPLLRVAHVPDSASGWTKLQAYLADKTDAAAAFATGFASGGTLGMTRVLQTDADREQLARHPVAEAVGEVGGAVSPGSLAGKLFGGLGRLGKGAGLGKYGASAFAGGVGSTIDAASHSGADALADKLHGRPLDQDAKSHFTTKLLGSMAVGSLGGMAGEGIASLAQRYRTSLRQPTNPLGTELTNAESTGTATDALSGLKPSSDVEKYLEKARGLVPGEDKALPTGSAVEYAASDVRGPLVAQQDFERAAALQRMENESGQMYSRTPELKQPKPVKSLLDTLLNGIRERSQPEAADKFLPGAADALGARNNSPFIDLARKVVKPRLALDVDAAKEAARTGGRVVTLEEAEQMGFPVKGLANEVNPETGLPHNAPSLSEYSPVRDSELLPGGAEPRNSMPTRPVPDWQPPDLAQGATIPEIDPAARSLTKTLASEPEAALSIPDSYNPKQFRVILDPRAYDAQKMEQVIKAIDQAGKAGTEAKVDSMWPELMRAARIDREQFGKAWSGLKNVHHQELTALEQRAAHAGITEQKPTYDELSGNAQKAANAAITNYGVAPKATNEALASLADNAGVRGNLETLRGTRAYSALKEKALPNIHESIGQGGGFARLGGLLPGLKLRGDAFARTLARGPEGEALYASKFNPRLLNEPLGREVTPSGPFARLLSMGGGALGVKTGSVYDSSSGRAGPGSSLSPDEKAKLQQLLEQP